jgi:two-component system, NtrC family, response regulator HydG
LFAGESPSIKRVLALIQSLADTDTPILILGETGTGKDLAARAIHESGIRKDKPFIKVDCASLPATLLEAELFGYEKGAFTGASEPKTGRFEAAGEGTLFLDEIGNIDVSLQTKLLRVLQDRVIERLGSNRPIPVNAHIISATNANIPEMLAQGKLRPDLYFRLNGVSLTLPPLREHPEDIPLLMAHFLQEACLMNDKPVPRISTPALETLCQYTWPGNVRELKHTAEYMALLGAGDELLRSDLPPGLREQTPPLSTDAHSLSDFPARTLPRSLSKRNIMAALRKAKGSRSLAAQRLGIGRDSLYRMMRKFGMSGLKQA